MTAFDPTTVLPVVSQPSGRGLRDVGYDEGRVDELLADLVVPVADRPLVAERGAAIFRELTSTPLRAAAATAWVFAALVATVMWLDQPTVSVQTSLGPAKANCGIDVYIYGYPDPAVARACRSAEAVHFGFFVPALLLVLAGLIAGTIVAFRRPSRSGETRSTIWSDLRHAPIQTALMAAGAVAVLVGLFALRPVPVQLVGSGVLLTAHCGAGVYFFGYPNSSIQTACQHAYSGHANLLLLAIIVTTIALIAFAQVAYVHAADRRTRQRLALDACALILAVIATVAVLPVSVNVNEGPAPVVAACGLDTFVAGYPDHAVQDACRAHFATHAAIGLMGGTLAILMIIWAAAITPNRPRRATIPADIEASQ